MPKKSRRVMRYTKRKSRKMLVGGRLPLPPWGEGSALEERLKLNTESKAKILREIRKNGPNIFVQVQQGFSSLNERNFHPEDTSWLRGVRSDENRRLNSPDTVPEQPPPLNQRRWAMPSERELELQPRRLDFSSSSSSPTAPAEEPRPEWAMSEDERSMLGPSDDEEDGGFFIDRNPMSAEELQEREERDEEQPPGDTRFAGGRKSRRRSKKKKKNKRKQSKRTRRK